MKTRKAVLLLLAALGVALFFAGDLGRLLTLDTLKANLGRLQAFSAGNPLLAMAAFMVLYMLQTALALPGAAILSLAAGALFGPLAGTLCAVSAATLGATLSFLVTRYLLHDAVQARFAPRLAVLNRELAARGFNYLLFLRLVPLFPFFLVNLAAGLTSLPLRTFVLATALGIIPGGAVYVNAGASLASITSAADILSPRVLGSCALLGLFALGPVFWDRIRARRSP